MLVRGGEEPEASAWAKVPMFLVNPNVGRVMRGTALFRVGAGWIMCAVMGEYVEAIFISGIAAVDPEEPSPPVVARRSPPSVAPPFSSSLTEQSSSSLVPSLEPSAFSRLDGELVFARLHKPAPGEMKLPKVMEP